MNKEQINETAYQFLEQKVGYSKSTANWYKKTYRFHQLSMQELRALSIISKTTIRQLIFEHGFGRAKVTLEDMDQLLQYEGEGFQLELTEYNMEAA